MKKDNDMNNDDLELESSQMTINNQMRLFILCTIGYFVVRIMFVTDEKNKILLLFVYLFFVVSIQLSTSETIIRQKCDKSNYNLAILSVVFPWLIGFGSMLLALMYMPGWKAPFANTFGYLVISLMGLNNIMNKIYLPSIDDDNKKLEPLLNKINRDYSLVVNEITPTNMFGKEGSFMSTNQNLFNAVFKNDELLKKDEGLKNPTLKSLYQLVVLKDTISEFIWFFLTGSLIITISYNLISGQSCNYDGNDITKISSKNLSKSKEYLKKQQEHAIERMKKD